MLLFISETNEGFGLAAIVAYLFGFPKKQVITISIETGIQNIGIPFLIIITNFPSPEADYALCNLNKI
jgi:sodium/bile acid cotransporter 3/5